MTDIDQLLVPISVAQPGGEDLGFSAELDAIAEARRHDDPALDQGEWKSALKEADWPFVAAQCEKLIQARSKDLRLAVWLAEAQAQTRHFRGLADGFTLLAGLCDRFWDALYPAADDGDQEQRIGNLAWLLARTPHLVRAMPLTEEGGVSLADFDAARQRAAVAQPDEWGQRPAPSGPSIDELDAQRRRNSDAFNATLLADAQHCLAALVALEAAVDRRLGADGPGFADARDVLHHAIDFIGLLAPADAAPAPMAAAPAQPAAARPDASIASRQQAVDQLLKVADFFRRTEPHSPVAYLADKAASWAGMPLHLWLRTVIKDPGQIAQLDELLGTVAPLSAQ